MRNKMTKEDVETLRSLPKELRNLHEKSLISLYINTDEEIGFKYTDKQLTKYLFQFVKSCKKLNNNDPIHIFCLVQGESK